MDGWIKIYRSFLDWEWFDNSDMVQLWIYLILTANVEDKKWHNQIIKRGQFVTSVSGLSKRLNQSPWKIRHGLRTFETTGEITITATNKYSIITICKYDTYQSSSLQVPQTDHKQTTSTLQKNFSKTTNKKDDSSACITDNCEDDEIQNHKQTTNKPQAPFPKTATTKEDKNIYIYNTIASKDALSELHSDADVYRVVREFFNETMEKSHAIISKINAKPSKQRIQMLNARLRDHSLEDVKKVIILASQSSFLNGGGNRPWKASFDWLMKPTNFLKVLEGNYNDIERAGNGERRNDQSYHQQLARDYTNVVEKFRRQSENSLRQKEIRDEGAVPGDV
nr:hypothetical protein [uncultured Prevotella sp.]